MSASDRVKVSEDGIQFFEPGLIHKSTLRLYGPVDGDTYLDLPTTSGTLATQEYVTANAGGGEVWTRVTATEDFTTSSTNVEEVTTIPGVLFDNESTYKVRMSLQIANTSGVNSTGVLAALGKLGLTGRVNVLVNAAMGSSWAGSGTLYAARAQSISVALNTASTGMVHMEGIATIFGGADTVSVHIYSATVSANVTVKAGSYFEYIKLT